MAYNIRSDVIDHGFVFGAATVRRLFHDKKDGSVHVGVRTRRAELEIRVTRTGLVTVWNHKTGRKLEEVVSPEGEK